MNINLAIAERARAGASLTAAEIDELAATDVLSLGMLADEVRRARVGDSVTYGRVVEQGAQGAQGAQDAQGAEVRLMELPPTLDKTLDIITRARSQWSGHQLTGFSLAEIVERSWAPLPEVLKQFKSAGLDAIVEAPVDRVTDLVSALSAAAHAGLPVRCLSLQKPISGSRTDYLLNVRRIVEQFPDQQTVAPLPHEQSITAPTTGYDDVRAVALARLALPSVRNIQVDWAQYGPKLAQVALTFGANDLDRVSTTDDESLGRRRTSVEDVRRNIAAAGLTAVQRT